MRRCILVLLVALAPLACAQNAPLTGEKLAKFLGSVSPRVINWTVTGGPDFIVYYGRANPPLAGTVGFYLGGWPSFKPDSGSTIVQGRLGIFPVKWYRKVNGDGTITQRALINLDYYWKSDVWVVAAHQSDVDQLVGILAQLPTFTKKPERIPGIRQTALEYYGGLIIGIAVFLTFLAIFVPTGWLLHRQWRRRQASLTRRLFLLSAYAASAIFAVAGTTAGCVWMLRSKCSQDVAFGMMLGSSGLLLLATLCLLFFLVAGLVVLIRSRVQNA